MNRVVMGIVLAVCVIMPTFSDDGSGPQAIRDVEQLRREYADVSAKEVTV